MDILQVPRRVSIDTKGILSDRESAMVRSLIMKLL